MRKFSLFAVALFMAAASSTAIASTAWIDDQVLVPMRSGAGGNYRIIDSAIRSGTRVDYLGTEGNWAKIRYNGKTGYIPSQYLSRSPTAAVQLASLQRRYKKLKADHQQTSAALDEVKAKLKTLNSHNSKLQNKLSENQSNLKHLKQVAANPLKISETNKQLNKRISLLKTRLDQLEANNNILKHDNTYQGWAFGLGTVIIGMLFGAWIKSRGKRSRGGWV